MQGLTRSRIAMYAGASGDFNPLHTDELHAVQVAGFPSAFAHGMLSMGLTGRVLTDWAEDAYVAAFGVRFGRQVWPGDSLRARATVTGVFEGWVEAEVVTLNQDGVVVVSGTGRLCPRPAGPAAGGVA